MAARGGPSREDFAPIRPKDVSERETANRRPPQRLGTGVRITQPRPPWRSLSKTSHNSAVAMRNPCAQLGLQPASSVSFPYPTQRNAKVNVATRGNAIRTVKSTGRVKIHRRTANPAHRGRGSKSDNTVRGEAPQRTLLSVLQGNPTPP